MCRWTMTQNILQIQTKIFLTNKNIADENELKVVSVQLRKLYCADSLQIYCMYFVLPEINTKY